MRLLHRVLTAAFLLVAPLAASAQSKVVLPNPRLIHCHAAQCSQLWQDNASETSVYPGQILTDVVDGSIVGLTAVYEKSVSIEELRGAINDRYSGWAMKDLEGKIWKVESEKLVIQLTEHDDGTKELIYLGPKLGSSLTPAVHLDFPCPTNDTKKTEK